MKLTLSHAEQCGKSKPSKSQDKINFIPLRLVHFKPMFEVMCEGVAQPNTKRAVDEKDDANVLEQLNGFLIYGPI